MPSASQVAFLGWAGFVTLVGVVGSILTSSATCAGWPRRRLVAFGAAQWAGLTFALGVLVVEAPQPLFWMAIAGLLVLPTAVAPDRPRSLRAWLWDWPGESARGRATRDRWWPWLAVVALWLASLPIGFVVLAPHR